MSFYLVRTVSKRNLVGLFFAESLPHLVVNVSKVADTENCEWIELPAGGISWQDGDTPIPLEGDAKVPWDRSGMTESWQEAFRAKDADWVRMLTAEDVV